MKLSPLLRPLAIAAAIVSLAQSVIFSVLTLLGILLIAGVWDIQSEATLAGAINTIYVKAEHVTATPLIIRGNAFTGFVWTYFFLSFVWMILSQSLLWAFVRHKYMYAKNSVMIWCVWTGIISILDVILVCLFGADYGNISHDEDAIYEHITAVGVMMTIAARGYVLVITNIVFVIILYMLAIKMETSDTVPIREDPYINAYGTPPWLGHNGPERVGRQLSNPGYDDRLDYNRGRSDGNYGAPHPDSQRRQTGLPRGPYIPDPDYSPPGSPLQKYPKSVLKSRSQY